MIFDARSISAGEVLGADVCIVGAGAAGITLALELARASVSVVLVEAGGAKSSGKSRKLYAGAVDDLDRHLRPDQDRHRQLGGTSTMWGGRCMPFDACDFEDRPHVPLTGWPIGRTDLDPYYERAHGWCECGDFVYDRQRALPGSDEETISGFTDGTICTSTVERWSPPTDFGKTYRAEIEGAESLRVLLNGVVVEIEAESDATRVRHVEVATFAGTRFRIAAKSIVLAGGGLEVTRLLLASDGVCAGGIGNQSDWLGRAYMCHLHGVVSRIRFEPSRNIVFGYEVDPDGVFCRRRLTISPEAQREHGLLNAYFLLDRPLLGDPDHGDAVLSLAFLAKRLAQKQSRDQIGGKAGLYWRHIRNILLGSPQVVSFLPRFGRRRFMHDRRVPSLLVRPKSSSYNLYYHSEQVPSPDSRITLGNERDELGTPRLRIDYRITDQDVESVHESHLVIGRELERQGCGTLTFERDDPRQHIRENRAVLGHHIGTTRMSRDPGDGVVDPDCRVHGMANLFVVSASVFPTSSQAHPTLTIVALAVRLADHLKTTLNRL